MILRCAGVIFKSRMFDFLSHFFFRSCFHGALQHHRDGTILELFQLEETSAYAWLAFIKHQIFIQPDINGAFTLKAPWTSLSLMSITSFLGFYFRKIWDKRWRTRPMCLFYSKITCLLVLKSLHLEFSPCSHTSSHSSEIRWTVYTEVTNVLTEM